MFSNDPDKVDPDAFQEVVEEFGLTAVQADSADVVDELVDFFSTEPSKEVRAGMEERPLRRQAEVGARRFRAIAPAVLDFGRLAHDLEPQDRRRVFQAFYARARDVADWPWSGGWGTPA